MAYRHTVSQFAHNSHTSQSPDVEAVVRGGPIYATHEVTIYYSTGSDEAQSCSMQTEKVPKHTGNN